MRPALFHRIQRVDEEIGDGVDEQRSGPDCGRRPRLEREAGAELADPRAQQRHGPSDGLVHRERHTLDGTAGEQLMEGAQQLVHAGRLRVQQLPLLGSGDGRDAARQELQPREDAHQRMAHLVNEPGRQRLGLLDQFPMVCLVHRSP